MRFIKPSYEILSCPKGGEVLGLLERAARTCYKSEDKIHAGTRCRKCRCAVDVSACGDCNGTGWKQEPSSYKLIRKLLEIGHLSVIEHCSVTVRFIANRGVTHELVRHRLVSYSQESTRYCNYSKGKHGGEISIIEPSHRPRADCLVIGGLLTRPRSRVELKHEKRQLWEDCLAHIEQTYLRLLELGETPQEARDILPIGLKTEIVTTANLREWRHIFWLRAINERAHPQIREVMLPLLAELQRRIPLVFDDVAEKHVA